jgi:hypothetical protein
MTGSTEILSLARASDWQAVVDGHEGEAAPSGGSSVAGGCVPLNPPTTCSVLEPAPTSERSLELMADAGHRQRFQKSPGRSVSSEAELRGAERGAPALALAAAVPVVPRSSSHSDGARTGVGIARQPLSPQHRLGSTGRDA